MRCDLAPVAPEPDIPIRADQIGRWDRPVTGGYLALKISQLFTRSPGGGYPVHSEIACGISRQPAYRGVRQISQDQQIMAMLGKKIVEPQWHPAVRHTERRIGRPLARSRSGRSNGVILDDWTVRVVDCKPRDSLAELFRYCGDLRQQRH